MFNKMWQRIVYVVGKPIGKFISGMHMPFSRKRMCSDAYLEVKTKAEPGDIILTYTYGEASVWFIPGKYKHIGWYLGGERVLEATTKGVIISHLSEFIMRRDGIGCFRAKFADGSLMAEAAAKGAQLNGKSYDFEFNTNNDKWYCSEIVFVMTKMVLESKGKEMPFKLKKRLGVDTIAPDDFAKAKEKWDCVVERP